MWCTGMGTGMYGLYALCGSDVQLGQSPSGYSLIMHRLCCLLDQMANASNLVSAFVSFMQPVQVKQQVESTIRTMCSEYSNIIAAPAGWKATRYLTHIKQPNRHKRA